MKKLILAVLLLAGLKTIAQPGYPKEYLPGTSINLSTKSDTLYVLDNSTMQKYLNYWVLYKDADTNNQLYVRELNTLKKVIGYKNEAIRNKNQETKEAIEQKELAINQKEEAEKKLKRSRTITKVGTLAGGVVGFLIGFLAF